ncbi:MAG: FlaA1/EpsC-like NDP-sugar epimerase [Bacillariaceae sp.]|jgi:FlaA1/EpsC-like NDP-sugar epimerase
MKLYTYNMFTSMMETSSSSSKRRRQLLELLCSPVLVVVTILVLSVVTTPINGYIISRPITTTAFARKLDGRGTSLLMVSSESSSSSSSKYKKVFVAGGSKGVGHAIVEKLSKRGTEVIALVRSEESKKELDKIEGVTAILGDAFDQKGVENAMDGCDAAITTLGGTTDDRRVDYEGNNNVIESAGILGVQRIILVTSIGW